MVIRKFCKKFAQGKKGVFDRASVIGPSTRRVAKRLFGLQWAFPVRRSERLKVTLCAYVEWYAAKPDFFFHSSKKD